jgi:L-ascorbate metabolism protein UlaG (beta-lactamase superfamily)
MGKNPHTFQGFRNNYPHDAHTFIDFLKWRWDRLWGRRSNNPKQGNYHFPLAKNDPAFLRQNRTETTLTWIGHASFLLQLKGVNILTDPHLTGRASPLSWIGPKRVTPPGLALEDLPVIDMVFISHNHYDHLDASTVKRLHEKQNSGRNPHFFVPLGLKIWFTRLGISKVTELDWWESTQSFGFTLYAVPTQHFSARTPFNKNKTLWAGWVIAHPEFKFFFAGDTGYSPDFLEIGRRLGPFDLSALPIGAYEPRWFMKAMHINPEEAVQIHRDLNSRYSVAMHWGTFNLTDEPMDEPPKRLVAAREAAGLAPETFFLMQHGQTIHLDPLMNRHEKDKKSIDLNAQ